MYIIFKIDTTKYLVHNSRLHTASISSIHIHIVQSMNEERYRAYIAHHQSIEQKGREMHSTEI